MDWCLSGGNCCGERGAWRVYSFQFTVVVCGAVMRGTSCLPQEDTGDKPYKNLSYYCMLLDIGCRACVAEIFLCIAFKSGSKASAVQKRNIDIFVSEFIILSGKK